MKYKIGEIIVIPFQYEGYFDDVDDDKIISAVENEHPNFPTTLTWIVSDWGKNYFHITITDPKSGSAQ